MLWKTNRHVDHDPEGNGPPFPSTSTFFGIAAAMLALWLLASGLGQFFGQPDSVDAIHSDIVPGPPRCIRVALDIELMPTSGPKGHQEQADIDR